MKKLLVISSLCILAFSSDASSKQIDVSPVVNWINIQGIQGYMEQYALLGANFIKEHANNYFQSTQNGFDKQKCVESNQLISSLEAADRIFEYARDEEGSHELEKLIKRLRDSKKFVTSEESEAIFQDLMQFSKDLYGIHNQYLQSGNIKIDPKIAAEKIDYAPLIEWSNTIGVDDQNNKDVYKWRSIGFSDKNIFEAKRILGTRIINISDLIKSSADNYIQLKKDGEKSSPKLEDTLNKLIAALGDANQLFRDAKMGEIGSPQIVNLRKKLRLNGIDSDVKDADLIQISQNFYDLGVNLINSKKNQS